MIGSGLCVFSKFPIAETFQRKYSLNGYPHRYQHGDWFGGKAVGLAQILMDEFKLNVYVTHVSKILEACSTQGSPLGLENLEKWEGISSQGKVREF